MQSDSRLVKLFRRGVEPAFDELVNRYRGALVIYAGAIAGLDRAEDVVQDSLVKAHRSLGGDQPIEPRPWLYTVVRNTALNDIRDNSKHRHDLLGETTGRVAPTHEVAERREELAAVVAAVSDLPESQRRALIGHELGGFSHEEIATELKLSTAASAKQLIYRARLSLRNAVGAMIPLPLIAWLVSDATGLAASGAATGAAAGAAAGAASGGAAVGTAGGGGFAAGLAGAGTAKLAVVAVVAGGSIATGVAVEERKVSTTDVQVETASASPGDSGQGGPGSPASLMAVVGGTSGETSQSTSGTSGDSKVDPKGSGDSGGPGSGTGSGSGSDDPPEAGGDDSVRPPVRDGSTSGSGKHGSDHESSDDDGGDSGSSGPSGGGHSGPGGGDDPAPPSGGDDDDVYVPPVYAPKPKPSGDSGSGYSGSGSGGSGYSGSGGSGSSGSGSGSEDDGPEHEDFED